MMADKGWKQFERRIAVDLGGRRVGILGKEDVEHPVFSIECKLLAELPVWFLELYRQAFRNCGRGKMPIAIVKEKGRRDDNAKVVLSYENFRKLAEAYVTAQKGGK